MQWRILLLCLSALSIFSAASGQDGPGEQLGRGARRIFYRRSSTTILTGPELSAAVLAARADELPMSGHEALLPGPLSSQPVLAVDPHEHEEHAPLTADPHEHLDHAPLPTEALPNAAQQLAQPRVAAPVAPPVLPSHAPGPYRVHCVAQPRTGCSGHDMRWTNALCWQPRVPLSNDTATVRLPIRGVFNIDVSTPALHRLRFEGHRRRSVVVAHGNITAHSLSVSNALLVLVHTNIRTHSSRFHWHAGLLGYGVVHSTIFRSERGSFIAPGAAFPRRLPPHSAGECFGVRAFTRYGNLTIHMHNNGVAKLHGAVYLKHMGAHPAFSPHLRHDSLFVNRATRPGYVGLIIGQPFANSTLAIQDNRYVVPTQWLPLEPSHVLCIASGPGTTPISANTPTCAAYRQGVLNGAAPVAPQSTTDPAAPLRFWSTTFHRRFSVRYAMQRLPWECGTRSGISGGPWDLQDVHGTTVRDAAPQYTSLLNDSSPACGASLSDMFVNTACCPPNFSGSECRTRN